MFDYIRYKSVLCAICLPLAWGGDVAAASQARGSVTSAAENGRLVGFWALPGPGSCSSAGSREFFSNGKGESHGDQTTVFNWRLAGDILTTTDVARRSFSGGREVTSAIPGNTSDQYRVVFNYDSSLMAMTNLRSGRTNFYHRC